MGNILQGENKESATELITNENLPLSPELCTDQNGTDEDYVYVLPTEPVIASVNAQHSEPIPISMVLPFVKCPSISPICKLPTFSSLEIMSPHAEALFKEYYGTSPTEIKSSATSINSANNRRTSVCDETASTSTIHTSSSLDKIVLTPSDISELSQQYLSLTSVNSTSESNDSESDNLSTFSEEWVLPPTTIEEIFIPLPKKIIREKRFWKPYWPKNMNHYFFASDFKNRKSGKIVNRIKSEMKCNSNQLSGENYAPALLIFADLEDLQCNRDIKVYSRQCINIERTSKSKIYIIQIPHLIDSRPKITVGTRVAIQPYDRKIYKYHSGSVKSVEKDFIKVKFSAKIDTDILYTVRFLCDRARLRFEKLAVELLKEKILGPLMCPKIEDGDYCASGSFPDPQFTWYNKAVADNPEQKIVVENIYNGTSYPYPYILFGPPGTGKTAVLVESILQLWGNKLDSIILVVAPSNFACNVIAKRLLQFLPEEDIFRLFSKEHEGLLDQYECDAVAALRLKGTVGPSRAKIDMLPFRIVVTTPCSSGRLILEKFSTKHFTHLFIDECASCTEGTSFIPIVGLVSSFKKINANIILVGDPLQLRPVIFSKYAEEFGYGLSMIERFMNFPMYQMNAQIGDYNNKFITKLRINYRSHTNILHISNKLFYNNEVRPMASKDITDWVINWPHLPNPNFPIVFQTVLGESVSEYGPPSLYNQHEIDVVMYYLDLLVNKEINGKMVYESDIGIISQYREQIKKIRYECQKREWGDIEVASVETFQGNEKSIIILSTVRGDVDTNGLFNNQHRLNVALTRAKGLLIIIGDPNVLIMDKCWYALLQYCYDNNAFCGEAFNFKVAEQSTKKPITKVIPLRLH